MAILITNHFFFFLPAPFWPCPAWSKKTQQMKVLACSQQLHFQTISWLVAVQDVQLILFFGEFLSICYWQGFTQNKFKEKKSFLCFEGWFLLNSGIMIFGGMMENNWKENWIESWKPEVKQICDASTWDAHLTYRYMNWQSQRTTPLPICKDTPHLYWQHHSDQSLACCTSPQSCEVSINGGPVTTTQQTMLENDRMVRQKCSARQKVKPLVHYSSFWSALYPSSLM